MFVLIFRQILTHSLYCFFSPNSLWMNTDETNGIKHFHYQSNFILWIFRVSCHDSPILEMYFKNKFSALLFGERRKQSKFSWIHFKPGKICLCYLCCVFCGLYKTFLLKLRLLWRYLKNFRCCHQSGSCETSG